MIDPTSPGTAALIGAVSAVSVAVITVGFPLLFRGRSQAQRDLIAAKRGEADRLNGTFTRLEKENIRLTGEVDQLRRREQDLDTALRVERDAHDALKRKCETMEEMLRRHGQMPPDENGEAR